MIRAEFLSLDLLGVKLEGFGLTGRRACGVSNLDVKLVGCRTCVLGVGFVYGVGLVGEASDFWCLGLKLGRQIWGTDFRLVGRQTCGMSDKWRAGLVHAASDLYMVSELYVRRRTYDCRTCQALSQLAW